MTDLEIKALEAVTRSFTRHKDDVLDALLALPYDSPVHHNLTDYLTAVKKAHATI